MSLLLALTGGGANEGNAAPGSYLITGFDAFGLRSLVANAEPGAYTLTGFDATSEQGAIANAEPGAYVITGSDAFSLRGLVGLASPGSYSIVGFDSTGTQIGAANAEPGSYVITGVDAFGEISGRAIPELPNEIYIKRWYVRKNGRVYVFNSAEEADAYIAADKQAEEAIAKAQATSKAAKKKIRRKIYDATGVEPESVSIDYVSSLVSLYGLQFDVPSLIAKSDFETFMQVALMAQAIEEEEIEMLLMA